MIKDNPFYVLGLNPDSLRGLNDEQIERMIKSQYRMLIGFFHPDHCGSKKKAEKIIDAFERLDKNKFPEAYELYKSSFLKVSFWSNRLKKTHERVLELEGDLEKSQQAFRDFFSKLIGSSGKLTLLDLTQFHTITLLDAISTLNRTESFPGLLRARKKSSFAENESENFFQLFPHPVFKILHAGKIQLFPNKIVVGCIPSQKIQEAGGLKKILRLAYPIVTPEEERMRIDPELSFSRRIKRISRESEISLFQNEIPESIFFQHFVPKLSPEIETDSILVSAEREARKQPRFFLEGRILAINTSSSE